MDWGWCEFSSLMAPQAPFKPPRASKPRGKAPFALPQPRGWFHGVWALQSGSGLQGHGTPKPPLCDLCPPSPWPGAMQRSRFGLGDRGATRPWERFCPSSLPAAPRAAANHIWGWEISFEALLMQRQHGTGPGLSPLSKARKAIQLGKGSSRNELGGAGQTQFSPGGR